MYKKINITENTLQVLELFTKFSENLDSEYYIREVQKILNISPRTAQLILDDLEKKGIIESKTRGKIKTYKLKNNEFAKRYIILTEQYKKISFLEDRPLINEIIENISGYIKGIGIIFGSYVKGLEKKVSDLDVLVIGSCKEEKIKEISKNYRIEINLKIYPERVFKKEIKKDFLLKEILKNHIVFSGIEGFIESVFENG